MWSGWIFSSLDAVFHYVFPRIEYPPHFFRNVVLNDVRFRFIWNKTNVVVLWNQIKKQFVSLINFFQCFLLIGSVHSTKLLWNMYVVAFLKIYMLVFLFLFWVWLGVYILKNCSGRLCCRGVVTTRAGWWELSISIKRRWDI